MGLTGRRNTPWDGQVRVYTEGVGGRSHQPQAENEVPSLHIVVTGAKDAGTLVTAAGFEPATEGLSAPGIRRAAPASKFSVVTEARSPSDRQQTGSKTCRHATGHGGPRR
jgi:hypothetical protein